MFIMVQIFRFYILFYDEDWFLFREFVSSVATHGHYASQVKRHGGPMSKYFSESFW